MISGNAMLAGVMGDPIGHSLSPLLHNHWLKQLELDGVYLPLHVSADMLDQALRALPLLGFKGVNLTIPHKEKALLLMDELSDVAQRIGAVNTVSVRQDGSLYGTNTDGEGFIRNLRHHVGDLSAYLPHCVIIGAGGAARGVAVALKDAGAGRITLTNRSRDKADYLAEMIDAEVVDWEKKETALADCSLLVNTTSLGMEGQAPLELNIESLPQTTLVTDIVYKPLITALLKQAQARGNKTVTGIGMLIHQAAPGFENWYGRAPVMDDACYALLEGAL